MSEARHQRFEIDIDEIERQLRRSVEAAPAPKPDPLAELARIVGQDDPFRGILGGAKPVQPGSSAQGNGPGADVSRAGEYDPAVDAYGSSEAAYAEDDLQPLRPRRSRGRLLAVLGALVLGVGATAGTLVWRNGGAQFSFGGLPPLITADKAPLKVAPENPGGIDVPNQDRQVYDKGASEGQSRVVDSREQPMDVREAVRALPPAPGANGASDQATSRPGPSGSPTPARSTSAISALGEPRRVRTVAVRPDGTTYTPNGPGPSPAIPELGPGMSPGSSLPRPVPVTTMSIPAGNAPATPQPAAPATAAATPAAASAAPVTVLPPQRPRFEKRGSDLAPVLAPASRLASAAPGDAVPAPEPVAAGKVHVVQIAVGPSEEEARAAYSKLAGRFGPTLAGKPTAFTKAEVAGKTVVRVRVGPLAKDAANTLCGRLKASGGQCFVATI